jgi:hypothetical protein
MMEALSLSETSSSFYQTVRRNIPEDSRLYTLTVPYKIFTQIQTKSLVKFSLWKRNGYT